MAPDEEDIQAASTEAESEKGSAEVPTPPPAEGTTDDVFRITDNPFTGDKFWLIAGDGKRYGPATREELRSWFLDGRIGPDMILSNESDDRRTARSVLAFKSAEPELAAPPVLDDGQPAWPQNQSAPIYSSGGPQTDIWGNVDHSHLAHAQFGQIGVDESAPGRAELRGAQAISVAGFVAGFCFFPVLLISEITALALALRAKEAGQEDARTTVTVAAAGIFFAIAQALVLGLLMILGAGGPR